MSQLKYKIIDGIIEREGGYVNDPSDSGGRTKYGITEKVARKQGYAGEMKNLPRSFAEDIYIRKYWDALKLNKIEVLSPLIAEELADTSVNMGTSRAARFLQRSLNVLNNRSQSYADLKVDGKIGGRTIKALKSYFMHRGVKGEKVLFNMLNALQGAFYVKLAERREKDEKFVYGWYENRIGVA